MYMLIRHEVCHCNCVSYTNDLVLGIRSVVVFHASLQSFLLLKIHFSNDNDSHVNRHWIKGQRVNRAHAFQNRVRQDSQDNDTLRLRLSEAITRFIRRDLLRDRHRLRIHRKTGRVNYHYLTFLSHRHHLTHMVNAVHSNVTIPSIKGNLSNVFSLFRKGLFTKRLHVIIHLVLNRANNILCRRARLLKVMHDIDLHIRLHTLLRNRARMTFTSLYTRFVALAEVRRGANWGRWCGLVYLSRASVPPFALL